MEHWAWLVFGLESVQIFPNMVSDFRGLLKSGSICHKNGFLIHPLRLAQYFIHNRKNTTHVQSPGDNKLNLKSRNCD